MLMRSDAEPKGGRADGKLVRALLSYALALFFWYKSRALARSEVFMST